MMKIAEHTETPTGQTWLSRVVYAPIENVTSFGCIAPSRPGVKLRSGVSLVLTGCHPEILNSFVISGVDTEENQGTRLSHRALEGIRVLSSPPHGTTKHDFG